MLSADCLEEVGVHPALNTSHSLHWQWSMLRPGPLSRRDTFLVGLWYRRVARRHRKATSKIPAVLLDPATWESMSDEEFLAIWDNPNRRL